jgi:hypothetical protein
VSASCEIGALAAGMRMREREEKSSYNFQVLFSTRQRERRTAQAKWVCFNGPPLRLSNPSNPSNPSVGTKSDPYTSSLQASSQHHEILLLPSNPPPLLLCLASVSCACLPHHLAASLSGPIRVLLLTRPVPSRPPACYALLR